jgi:hypothetical protein
MIFKYIFDSQSPDTTEKGEESVEGQRIGTTYDSTYSHPYYPGYAHRQGIFFPLPHCLGTESLTENQV